MVKTCQCRYCNCQRGKHSKRARDALRMVRKQGAKMVLAERDLLAPAPGPQFEGKSRGGDGSLLGIGDPDGFPAPRIVSGGLIRSWPESE
jgi:hypothetical protein